MLTAAVDVGSVPKGRFAWSARDDHDSHFNGRSPETLVEVVREALTRGQLVALGFESPLVVPVPRDAADLGKARVGEPTRSWSASAGASVMGTGLVQLAWVLRELGKVRITTQPARWSDDVPLLVWEAFVSGDLKTDRSDETGHLADAEAAVRGFLSFAGKLPSMGRVHLGEHAALNLAAAAAVAAGSLIDSDEIGLPLLILDGAGPVARSADNTKDI